MSFSSHTGCVGTRLDPIQGALFYIPYEEVIHNLTEDNYPEWRGLSCVYRRP